MEEIKEELKILQKSFPFIKFRCIQPHNNIQIRINNQSISYLHNYRFWYNKDQFWKIEFHIEGYSFNEFLNHFINGLIYWGLY